MKHDLLAKIRNGDFLPNERLPGERQLAEIYSVSYMTARKVIDELTNARILNKRPRSGIFVSSEFLRILMPEQRTIALVAPEFSEMSARIFDLLEQKARHCGFVILPNSSVLDINIERQILEMLLRSNVSGVIFTPIAGERNLETVRKLTASGIPVVTMDQAYHDTSISSVECDNFQCAYLATRHLIEKGHRNIVHITVSRTNFQCNQVARDRYAGFRQAKLDYGLPCSRFDLVHLPIQYTYLPMSDIRLDELGYQEAFTLLRGTNRPTAILAVFDELVFGIYHAARALHLEIPRDLSVIGINDSNLCRLCLPPLTTIQQPIQKMINQAVDYLAEYVRAPQNCRPVHEKYPGVLISRRSVDVPSC